MDKKGIIYQHHRSYFDLAVRCSLAISCISDIFLITYLSITDKTPMLSAIQYNSNQLPEPLEPQEINQIRNDFLAY